MPPNESFTNAMWSYADLILVQEVQKHLWQLWQLNPTGLKRVQSMNVIGPWGRIARGTLKVAPRTSSLLEESECYLLG